MQSNLSTLIGRQNANGLNAIRAASGFTLMELMVVVAILVVLAALMLPALERARQASDKIRCANNLRQLVAGAILYANDHDGLYLPPVSNDSLGFRQWMFNDDYLQILGLKPTQDLKKLPDLFRCSRAVRLGNTMGISYGANITGLGISAGNYKTAGFIPRTKMVPRASQKVYLIESLDWWVSYAYANGYTNSEVTTSMTPAYRHDRGANVAFFDGHVEYLKSTDLIGKQDVWDIPAF
ncbi:MAG: hypothetical protein B9S32_09955 [Verrucomicrobia bacterium Tous-C9LFEB]|nr:MAG: hypothetical protein B9S32_09955 [Verrucomicrobia bacterium Tous-C9LFEB]